MHAGDESRKPSRPTISPLRRERELRAWTQSQVAERIGTTQVNISRWENGAFPSPYYRQRLAELFGKSVQELGLIPGSGKEHAEKALPLFDTSDISDAQISPVPIWNVPYRRNPFFTGRKEILARLYTSLRNRETVALTQAQAISGLGGIGKTQVAVEYAYRYRDSYQAVFWLNASTREALSADLVMVATLLGLPKQYERKQDIVVRAVKRWLASHTGWLLILDNVDDLGMIVDFLPAHGTGDVLLTTRLQALGNVAQSIEVEKMKLEEGMMFLLRRIKALAPDAGLENIDEESRREAAAIVTELDGLPLALDQAGAYIEETRCGLSRYLGLYGSRRKELLLRRGRFPVEHPDSVAATWSLSFQQVERENPAATNLLLLLAFLDSEAVPEEIITQGAAELGPQLESAASDPLRLDHIIELLLRYSLIRRNAETKSLSIHRLVQAVLKDSMNRDTQRLWAERTIRAVNRAFPVIKLETWDRCQRYLSHVLLCAQYSEEYELISPEAAHLFNEAASYLVARARSQQAESFLLKALSARQKLLEASHPDIAHTLNDLGEVYRMQGKYLQAEPLLREALAIRQDVLAEAHPDVAQTLHNLANLYRTQGRYTEAEPLYLRALQIREAIPDIDPVLVADSYYGLARLYYGQARYQEAEKLCKQALQILEQNRGDSRSMIASTLNMLAKVYQGQNKFKQAKEMNERALQIRENASGPEHPKEATIANSLAEIYHAEGNYREAEPLIVRALRIQEQALGSMHPYTAYSLRNLAENYFLRGDYIQAEAYYKQALAVREQSLGLAHPHTATSYYDLAKLYTVLERYEEAKKFYCKSLSIRERVFGCDHPIVANTLESYAALLKKAEARKTNR